MKCKPYFSRFVFALVLPVTLLPLTACVSDPKSHFMLRELDVKQQTDYASANIILLGEQHDNPVHHQIQNEILQKLGRDNRLKAVVFEQIDWTEQGVLSQLNAGNLERLPKSIEWDKSGWPPYEIYKPLFATAVEYKATVIAGGLPKNRIDLIYKQGYEGGFSATEIERLYLRTPLDGVGTELMQKEIFEGHCKMVPEDHIAKMIPVQRARDAALVRGYQNEAPTDGVTVFILGAGHARKEFGVPTLLKLAFPKAKIWSVGMQEEGAAPFPEGAYDKVWITEKFERPDPCVAMQKHMDGKTKVEEKAKDTEETEKVEPRIKEPEGRDSATPSIEATPDSTEEEAEKVEQTEDAE